MVRKTTFACSSDETRPALNGVLWQTKGDKMQMVATDGHRLAKMAVGNTKLKGMNEDVIIPPKVLNLIPKFLDGGQGDVGIIFGDNNIIFNLGDVVLTSRLIDGPYPNFEQVIPTSSDKKLTVSKDDLAAAVRRVSILSNALTHQVRFSLRKGHLTLATSNADVGGEGREVLDCDFQGEPLELGYNATYITDILSRTDSARGYFRAVNTGRSRRGVQPGYSKEDFLCLVMPLRLAE